MPNGPYTPPLDPKLIARLRAEAKRRNTKMTWLLNWITQRGLDALEQEDPPQEKAGLHTVEYHKEICPTCGASRRAKHTLTLVRTQ